VLAPTFVRLENIMSFPSSKPVDSVVSPPDNRLPIFPPIELVNRPTVPTAQAAYYLNRKPQTLRGWAMNEKVIRPVRLNGRLAWPIEAIKAALAGGQ
jgi:hypothetical protein